MMSNAFFLFFSDYTVNVYSWKKGSLTAAEQFENSEEGQDAFRLYWKKCGFHGPVYLLVDVIEEDLHNETVPKLLGNNRSKMLAGRSTRLFRHTPFHFSHIQGKAPGEAQKELALFIGLTEPDALLAWLTILQEQRAHLAGIVSVPVLCAALFKKIAPEGGDALFVVPSAGGLRQIFMRDGRIQVSRLSVFPRSGDEHLQLFIHGEVARMQGYLGSLRLVPHNTTLEVYTLCHESLYAALTSGENSVSTYNSHPVATDALIRRLSLPLPSPLDHAETLLCGFLLKQKVRNHYARPEDTRIYRTFRLRLQLQMINLAFLVLGLLIGGITFLDGFTTYAQLPELSQQADKAQMALQAASAAKGSGAMGSTAISSSQEGHANPVTAVLVLDALREHATEPHPLLSTLSQVLTQHPTIWLEGIEWAAGVPDTGGADPKKVEAKRPPRSPPAAAPTRATAKPGVQNARLRGEVYPFSGDTKQAREKILAFIDALRALPTVLETVAISLPVDPSQTAVLDRGNMVTPAKQANFILSVTLQAEKKVP
ncbi:MAG: hypothetical protein H7835_05100 [Magnetococcus sp. XQGC-1]